MNIYFKFGRWTLIISIGLWLGLGSASHLALAASTGTSASATVNIGETSVLKAADSDNGNLLLAQSTTLSKTATINSLSFYVTTAKGSLRLGIYDATGPHGGPGALKAQTNGFTPTKGWNTANVITPVLLPAGTYWLTYLPSSNALSFVKENNSGACTYYHYAYGAMPSTYKKSPNSCTPTQWSFYATLTTSSVPPPASCGSTPSGSTVTETVSTTAGSTTPTTAQCPYGGTEPATTVVTQTYLCTNGTLSTDGSPVSTTTDGTPKCNAPASCGSTASGSTVTETVSTTAGSTTPTTAQCPYGGTEPTTTVVTQTYLCTNGALSADGSPVSTTTDGTPACNPAPVTPVNGSCGSANGSDVTSAPTSGLCTTGTSSSVTGSGPYDWSCAGANGGTTASCSALLKTNGSCGSANGVEIASAPTTNLCGSGSATSVSETGTTTWNWSCNGSNGGSNSSCSAPVQPVLVNGTCGSANGTGVTSAPSTNLCATGVATSVSGTGPWTWVCNGTSGGTNSATCTAPVLVNGTCGSANGTTVSSAPTSNLCSTGTATAVSGSGPFTWSCDGSNGGATTSCSASLTGTTGGSILPSYDDASANWKNAGLALAGGIPNRTTVCATVNPLGGGKDDFTNIQNAINNCPAGQVVQLGAGAFTVHIAELPIQISTGITLRGTGNCSGTGSPYCQTSINVSDGALAYTGGKCGTSTSSETTCPNGGPAVILMAPVSPDYNYSWAKCGNTGGAVGTGCGATLLTADAAQGQTTIQVSSTSGFSVGQWVLIDEASGAGWVTDPLNQWTGYGSVWASSDWLSPSGSPATGRVMWSKSKNGGGWDFGSTLPSQADSVGCWHSYCDRPTAELHKIASIGTNTLTFDDPLTIAFRQSGGHNAQVYGGLYSNQSGSGTPISFLQNAGVEDLSVLRGVNGGLEMEFCANCWLKNTEVGDWYGGGVNVEYSVRSELNTVYVHHCWDSVNNGGEYPIALDNASTEILITNSITNFAGKGMVARAGGAGSVVSYSYVDDTMYDAESGIGDYWVDMGLNASHYSGPHHVLFEGDWADNLDNDHTHGNSMYMTFFRNQGTGLRTPFVDPSINETVDDFTGIGYCGSSSCKATPGPLRAAGPSAYNYWFAFVGNVLGLAGETTAANGWTYQGDWSSSRMFMLGWNDGNGGEDPYLDGVSGSYVDIDGNYDYVTNSVQWASTDTAHTLPNSLYLSGEPSSFEAGTSCTYPWPWVTPTGSKQVQSNSCGGSGLPAKARYEAGTPFTQP